MGDGVGCGRVTDPESVYDGKGSEHGVDDCGVHVGMEGRDKHVAAGELWRVLDEGIKACQVREGGCSRHVLGGWEQRGPRRTGARYR